MKSIYAFSCLVFLTFFSVKIYAQPCTPDTSIKEYGLYPKTFPDATAGVAYTQVIQFKFPKDTTFAGSTVPIDSVQILDIILPASFTAALDDPDSVYAGGANGCALINGLPVKSQIGDYQVRVQAQVYVKIGGVTFPAFFEDSIPFKIVPNAGIFDDLRGSSELVLLQNTPNPFSAYTDINFYLSSPGPVNMTIFNLTGKKVSVKRTSGFAGNNSFRFYRDDLKPGLYFYSVEFDGSVLAKSFMIRD